MLCIINNSLRQNLDFCDKSFKWFLNYIFFKFLEILTNENRRVSGKKQSVSMFLSNCACAAFNWVLSVTKKKFRIVGLFTSLPFLIYL